MNNIERVRERLFNIADALIVTDEKTGMYLCGFPASDSTVFITKNSAVLFTDPRYIEAAEKEVRGCTAKLPEVSVIADIKKMIADEGIKTVAFEDRKLTVSALSRYESLFPGVKLVPAGDLIESLCELKTEEELAAIRAAQELTDKAFAEVLPLLNYNMTEQEVAAELEYRMKRLGAQGPSFETIAVSGTQS
ncbi:MAG: M24 family metallopeptidase, partial [Eubacteriales bacterium]